MVLKNSFGRSYLRMHAVEKCKVAATPRHAVLLFARHRFGSQEADFRMRSLGWVARFYKDPHLELVEDFMCSCFFLNHSVSPILYQSLLAKLKIIVWHMYTLFFLFYLYLARNTGLRRWGTIIPTTWFAEVHIIFIPESLLSIRKNQPLT